LSLCQQVAQASTAQAMTQATPSEEEHQDTIR
jgi:hypothetical protein